MREKQRGGEEYEVLSRDWSGEKESVEMRGKYFVCNTRVQVASSVLSLPWEYLMRDFSDWSSVCVIFILFSTPALWLPAPLVWVYHILFSLDLMFTFWETLIDLWYLANDCVLLLQLV